jgi:hypothetical protein
MPECPNCGEDHEPLSPEELVVLTRAQVFQSFNIFAGCVLRCIMAEPSMDLSTLSASWHNENTGSTLSFAQGAPNKMLIEYTVPMDDIIEMMSHLDDAEESS